MRNKDSVERKQMNYQIKKKKNILSISWIFVLSCLFFFLASIFGVYNYRIYDKWSLIVFYIYEIIFLLGIQVAKIRINKWRDIQSTHEGKTEYMRFALKRQGYVIVHAVFIGAMLSFIYFLFLYMGSFNIASFGHSLKAKFDELARTKLEVITQFIMFAGSAVYLIVIGAKSTVSKSTLGMARICLFLPGLRGAFLGRRFTLAIEAMILFFAECESINMKKHSLKHKDKRAIKKVAILIVVVVIILLDILSQMIVFLTDDMRIANPDDMWLKPFWSQIYSQIGNRMSVFAYLSFYAGHAPYAFSYSYANIFPDVPQYWGLSTFRVFIQIITTLFGMHPNYAEMAYQVPGIARYTGYTGALIQDFGKYMTPIVSFLFGFIFSKIEIERNQSSVCHALYPVIQVACLFAPVYFFSVGNIDQVSIWTIILAPLCLSRIRDNM